MSFSIAVTVPFTTLPSKVSFSPPRLSLRRAAKSSRVGNVVVAIKCVVSRNSIGPAAWPPPWRAFTCGPGQMHCRRGTMPLRRPWAWRRGQPVHDKKRVPVPVVAGTPYALAKGRAVQRDRRPPDGARLSLEGGEGQGVRSLASG